MVLSVRAQTYARWELILVNASPEDEELAGAVREAGRSDERVKIVALEENGGISANSNAGIAVASGDFVSFFDHDDLIEPDLLYEYALAVLERPDTDLLYCDEDKKGRTDGISTRSSNPISTSTCCGTTTISAICSRCDAACSTRSACLIRHATELKIMT